ncbi:hypothetical protein ONS96_007927 [Cadophora gregata f. sp. sojae]|nr:hypothetical protein ONS96_007927 [Cadophora gregata f. sp. sojae]
MQLGRPASNRNSRASRSARGRGQDSMSRGASSSTTKAGTPQGLSTPNAFEKERAENAAKRAESKNHKGIMSNGRGGRGNGPSSKLPSTTMTPFAMAPAATSSPFDSAAPTAFNPFGSKPSTTLGTNGATSNSNPFGAPSNPETAVNAFGKPGGTTFGAVSATKTPINPFGAPSKPEAVANPFGKPSSSPFGAPSSVGATFNPFDKPSSTSSPFPANPNAASNVFGARSSNSWPNQSPGVFGTQSTPNTSLGAAANEQNMSNLPDEPKPSPFGTPSKTSFASLSPKPTNTFGSLASSSSFGSYKNASGSPDGTSGPPGPFANPTTNGTLPKSGSFPNSQPANTSSTPMFSKSNSSFEYPASPKPAANSLAAKVEQQLKKDQIGPPRMPTYDLMFERQLLSVPELMQHLRDYKAYQEKVRSSLMKAGLIDDPEKPKSLKDAIDFKGTCEDMCPQLEKIERLVEGRVDISEKGVQDDGSPTRHAVMEKMVKILARSSAGQAAPLPSEVRTTAALRRTVDYLMKDVLTESNISKVHGFLWNRTRAIRRDFVFHSFMTPPELVDQVYCLETIARFHTISLHLMSKPENYSETFDTHQEFEQLGNTMISLMQAYGDCKANGVVCPNEAEFRAYLVVIQRKSNPGLLEMVHSWGWDLFEAKEMKLALSMAEALGNTWDMHGPLKPTAPTNIAQNAFSRFFDIVKDKQTSYTMACFAEIWFNDAREAIVRTILATYRKQRNQIKDWTVPVLNEYLRFDDETDVIPWCEARDIVFEEADGSTYLSMEPGNVLNHIEGKQYHSHSYVEKKRGSHSLQHVLYHTVFDEAGSLIPPRKDEDEEGGLFVKQSDPIPKQNSIGNGFLTNSSMGHVFDQNTTFSSSVPPPAPESQPKPISFFDRVGNPAVPNGGSPGTSSLASPSRQSSVIDLTPPSIPAPSPSNSASTIFTKQPAAQQPPFLTGQPVHGTGSFFPSQSAGGAPPFFPQQVGGQASPKPSATQTSILTQPLSQSKEVTGGQVSPIFSFTPTAPAQSSVLVSGTAPSGNESMATPRAAISKHVSFFPQSQVSTTPSPATVATPTEPIVQSSLLPSQPLSEILGPPAPRSNKQNSLPSEASQVQSDTPKESPEASAFPSLLSAVPRQSAFSAEPPSLPFDKFAGLTDWFVFGSEGIVEQFTSYQVGIILKATAKQFLEEENARKTKEADDAARAEADLFRYRTLATKYGTLWREQAHLRWLKRRGREARKARREMAETFRASKAAQSAAVVEDFRSSTTRPRKDSLESLLGATGVLNGVHDANGEPRAIAQENRRPSQKRQRSQHSERSTASQSSTASKHKRGKSDIPIRQSILSDPSYLQGGSRIHLLSDYNLREEQQRPQISGVQTDYFRLKARGLSILRDGIPPALSAAQRSLNPKRSFDGFMKPTTPRSRLQSTPRSVPSKPAEQLEVNSESGDKVDEVEALKARAKAAMSWRKSSGQKRSFDDEDEELFARAKRIREQMEEGEDYYRRELDRESGSRSAS